MKKGGPPALPPTCRNKLPADMVMSFTPPEVSDGYTLVILQASSQLPAFGRYCVPLPGEIREDRVSDNPMGNEYLWSPITNPHWETLSEEENATIWYGCQPLSAPNRAI